MTKTKERGLSSFHSFTGFLHLHLNPCSLAEPPHYSLGFSHGCLVSNRHPPDFQSVCLQPPPFDWKTFLSPAQRPIFELNFSFCFRGSLTPVESESSGTSSPVLCNHKGLLLLFLKEPSL